MISAVPALLLLAATALPAASGPPSAASAAAADDDDGCDPLERPGRAPMSDAEFAARMAAIRRDTKRWAEGTFEIHMFEVGQGNSQLIIFPSGFTILIDVAENSWNTRRGAELVAAKVEAILGHTRVDIGSPSHWHLDHLGYVGYGGFWYLVTSGAVTFGKIIDRDGGAWAGEGPCVLPNSGPLEPEVLEQIDWRNVGTTSGTSDRWICWATDPRNEEIYRLREVAVGGSNQFDPPDEGSSVEVIITDAKGVKMVDGATPVSGDQRFWRDENNRILPPSENDYCIALVVRHGEFSYFTGGDLDGTYSVSSWGYTYNDVETHIAKDVGPVDLFQVNHHGSSHSTNQLFVDTLRPQASLISCGQDNSHGHPAQAVLDRVLAASDVFLHHVCAAERDYGNASFTGGDTILVRSEDLGETFTVHDRTYKSRSLRSPTPPLWRVKTAETTVTVDITSGALRSILRNTAGEEAEFLSGTDVPLFVLKLTRANDTRTVKLNSSAFLRISVASSTPRRLELHFAGHEADEWLEANATIFAGDDGLVHFRLAASNTGSGWAVQSALYPGMQQPATLSQPGDELLYPCFEGVKLPNPGHHIGLQTPGRGMYPNGCPVQFGARYGDSAGLYFAAQDGTGQVKGFELSNSMGEWVRMDLTHFTPEVPGAGLELGYDTVVGTFGRGGWRAAAAMYKSWAVQQPWCATKLSERTDVPDVLLSGAPGIISGIQNEQGYSAAEKFGPRLEKLPDFLAEYKAKINTSRLIFVPYGWENRGTWAGINYFPAQPSNESWIEVNRELRKTGDATMFLVSGYWWVTKRAATFDGPAFDDSGELAGLRRQGSMLVKVGPNGSAIYESDQYNLSVSKQPWRGLSVELCHGHVNATRTLASIAAGCRSLGAEIVSFDQEIGGGQQAPCYDPQHDHPPGYGRYMWTGFEGLLKTVKADAAAAGQKLGLSTEQTSELSIPYMGTYWSRQFAVTSYPLWGFEGVGLFSYLYHEFVPAMSAALVQGQGPSGVPEECDYRMRVTAMALGLTRGTTLMPFDHDVLLAGGDSWHRNVSAAFFSFAGVSAAFPEWLVLGESVVPPALGCANLSAWYFRHDARTGNVTKQPIVLRSAVVGSFRADDGTTGTVVASVTHQPQTVSIPSVGARVLYDGRRTELRRWSAGAAPAAVECELAGFGVCFLVAKAGAPERAPRLKSDEARPYRVIWNSVFPLSCYAYCHVNPPPVNLTAYSSGEAARRRSAP